MNPTIGTVVCNSIIWGIYSQNSNEVVDTGVTPEAVIGMITKRMDCDWDRAYDLGFRVCQVRPQYRIMSILIERPEDETSH